MIIEVTVLLGKLGALEIVLFSRHDLFLTTKSDCENLVKGPWIPLVFVVQLCIPLIYIYTNLFPIN